MSQSHDFKYDLAISYARPDRGLADKIYEAATRAGYRVFIDHREPTGPIARSKTSYYTRKFAHESNFVVVVLTSHYVDRAWPPAELSVILNTMVERQRLQDYLILVQLDEELPGDLGWTEPLLNVNGEVQAWDLSEDETAERVRRVLVERLSDPESTENSADPASIPRPRGNSGTRRGSTSREQTGPDPDAYLPFAVDASEAERRFHSWAEERFLAPKGFRHGVRIERQRSVYVPYWNVKLHTTSRFRGERRLQVKGEDGVERLIPDPSSPLIEKRHHPHDPVPYRVCAMNPAEAGVPGFEERLELVEKGWAFNDLYSGTPFDGHEHLPATLAREQTYNELSTEQQAKIKRLLTAEIMREIGSEHPRIIGWDPSYKQSHELVLAPLWIIDWSFEDRVGTVLVNGQNAAIAGGKVLAAKRVALLTVSIIAAIAVLCFSIDLRDKAGIGPDGLRGSEEVTRAEFTAEEKHWPFEADTVALACHASRTVTATVGDTVYSLSQVASGDRERAEDEAWQDAKSELGLEHADLKDMIVTARELC